MSRRPVADRRTQLRLNLGDAACGAFPIVATVASMSVRTKYTKRNACGGFNVSVSDRYVAN